MSTRPCTTLCLALAATCIFSSMIGCASNPRDGYALESAHDSTIRTVSVPMFQNPTFTRGIEVELTDAVIKEIQRSTPWRVTRDSGTGGGANATLSGTLSSVNLKALSDGRVSGYAQEMSVRLAVDFDFKDNRTRKTIASRRGFIAGETFTPAQPVGERIESGQHAAVQRLARDIVAELRSQW